MTLPTAILLMGPTAAGKTDLALYLHEHLPVDIISVDASQVYRGLDIGTAKPTPQIQARAPHRLIDIRDPAEPYSAAEFRADALREMSDVASRGRIPLLVGGTMFYFRALASGLSDLPSADPMVREQLRAEAEKRGWSALHARLAVRDPEAAARINVNDTQRIQRALELIELTGETPTALNRRTPPAPPPFNFVHVALVPEDRVWLHSRIAKRFEVMLELGLVKEVELLYQRGDLSPLLPSVRTVGYRQVWDYLTGRVTYNQMTEHAIAATRQLAKRQLTWLRQYQGKARVFDSKEKSNRSCLTYLQECLRQCAANAS
ncbi:MAG TPA: tRNA (adenosine(37)-N6)-dimethylallyltransferase MiaA [Burkholderiales bacterium]|nr:tRNA (adenosine(37)-N6)-dimethylallyltransferase MiaA [Burkholderiales bacterium]